MTKIIEKINGGGEKYLLDKKLTKGILTKAQLEDIKAVGTCMFVTASQDGQPHCTIVEPSQYHNNEIIIPIVQMIVSVDNIKQNSKVFIHITKVNKDNYGDSIQYKLSALASIETRGKLYEEVKHYEETERLPAGWTVKGIVRAKLVNVEEVIG